MEQTSWATPAVGESGEIREFEVSRGAKWWQSDGGSERFGGGWGDMGRALDNFCHDCTKFAFTI